MILLTGIDDLVSLRHIGKLYFHIRFGTCLSSNKILKVLNSFGGKEVF